MKWANCYSLINDIVMNISFYNLIVYHEYLKMFTGNSKYPRDCLTKLLFKITTERQIKKIHRKISKILAKAL